MSQKLLRLIIALILGDVYWPDLLIVGQAGVWVVVMLALISAADYFRRFNVFLSPRVPDFDAMPRAKNRKVG